MWDVKSRDTINLFIYLFRIERVLCDKRIMDDAPRHLGKPFYSKKKIPISVDMAKQDLKEEVIKIITFMFLDLSYMFILQYIPLNLCGQEENSKWMICRQKTGVKCGY